MKQLKDEENILIGVSKYILDITIKYCKVIWFLDGIELTNWQKMKIFHITHSIFSTKFAPKPIQSLSRNVQEDSLGKSNVNLV